MSEHRFGGGWTTEKLERVRHYLQAYTIALSKQPHFTTNYVDAFAGTGYRSKAGQQPEGDLLIPSLMEEDNVAFLDGSARIALQVEPPFHRYWFVEREPARAQQLEKLKVEFPLKAQRINIRVEYANGFLVEWSKKTDWRDNRAVVFLDPYGMQVDWITIEAIAETRAIDLWVLFPLAVAVGRILTKNEPPPAEWALALTRFFGTDEWLSVFYPPQTAFTLFGPEETRARQADFDAIGQFFVNRLKGVFAGVSENPLPLFNSRGVPLYLLCFAVGNPSGRKLALRIANHILGGARGDR
jgi:three-Cys-motif partner protein